ncbi:Receptor-type tyrosine-protein phosphatase C [Labeo rohita]|uniref:Receptor-type tyrosine-protein phosphatase C n=1 Tax=Labeo rohita TaxID=84645 RepID=A0ABQ8LI40_LABRO|nr:Receptor-type tyrosine-protein phosphatase C [Labeo rohita]
MLTCCVSWCQSIITDPQSNLSTSITSSNTSADATTGKAGTSSNSHSCIITLSHTISHTLTSSFPSCRATSTTTQPSARNDTTPNQPDTHSPTHHLHSFASYEFVNVHIHAHTGQYNLMKIVNNNTATTHVVNIIGSVNQTYTIRIKDKHNEIRAQQIFNQTAFEIPFEWLRPCTVYNVSVDDCTSNGSNTFTSSEQGGTVPKTVVETLTDNEVCLKGEFTDIQWNLIECVKITEQNSCTSTHTVVLDTCNYTMNVDMPPVKPEIRFNPTVPSQFEWTNKPARCNPVLKHHKYMIKQMMNEFSLLSLSDEKETYGLNVAQFLSLNEQYSCIGEYPYQKRLIKSNSLSFQIPCDGQKNGRFENSTSTSFEISWNPLEGDQCSGIIWDSFSASCKTRDGVGYTRNCVKYSGTSTNCIITNLFPYKNYICSINGKVNKRDYVIFTGEKKTLSDKPIFKSEIEVTHPDHNSLEIKCEKKEPKIIWNGGKGTFKAEITYNGETISKTSDTCLFTFSDLYYLTTYDVKVLESHLMSFSICYSLMLKSHVCWNYNLDNRKAVVGFLAFLITVTSVVLFLIYLHKRKRSVSPSCPLNSLNTLFTHSVNVHQMICQHKNGEDEESVYVNVPIRLHKIVPHKATQHHAGEPYQPIKEEQCVLGLRDWGPIMPPTGAVDQCGEDGPHWPMDEEQHDLGSFMMGAAEGVRQVITGLESHDREGPLSFDGSGSQRQMSGPYQPMDGFD